MSATPAVDGQSANQGLRRLVIKNTVYLTLAQVITIPISVLLNGVLGRYLGAEEFGNIYFAATLAGFGALAVDWGHNGALPALIARDRAAASRLLGTSLVWRLLMAFVAYGVLALGCHLLGYGSSLQWALALSCVISLATSLTGACKDTIRGFERTDIPALGHVATQLLVAVVVIPVVVLGGRMVAALTANAVALFIGLVPMYLALRLVGVGPLSVGRDSLRSLFQTGTPFVFFGLSMAIHPNIDAYFMSKLASSEVIGWYAAARRINGFLLFPASALIGALYPTLARLHSTDMQAYLSTTSGALRGVAALVVPIALGCALYPELGIMIFSRSEFGPAETNLRILSLQIFLVYFTMPLGCALLAAGRQRVWSLVMGLCILVSLVLDPLLVPLFQERFGNGGLGVCVAVVVSEVLVVICALILTPKQVFDRKLLRVFGSALFAGLAMAASAWLTRPFGPFVSAPLAVIVYGAALWLTGGVERAFVESARGFVNRKLKRGSAPPPAAG